MQRSGIPWKNRLVALPCVVFIGLLILNLISFYLNATILYTYTYITLIIAGLVFLVYVLIKESITHLRIERRVWLILSIILILTFAIRYWNLTAAGLHIDEYLRLERGRTLVLEHKFFGDAPFGMVLDGVVSLLGGTNPLRIEYILKLLLGACLTTFSAFIVFLVGHERGNYIIGLLSSLILGFSYEFFYLSKTFLSEPKIALLVSLLALSFAISLRKPKYVFISFLLVVFLGLSKKTCYSIFPAFLVSHCYLTAKRHFSVKDLVASTSLCGFLWMSLYIYRIIAVAHGKMELFHMSAMASFPLSGLVCWIILLLIIKGWKNFNYKTLFFTTGGAIFVTLLLAQLAFYFEGVHFPFSNYLKGSYPHLVYHLKNLYLHDSLIFFSLIMGIFFMIKDREDLWIHICAWGISSLIVFGFVSYHLSYLNMFERHIAPLMPLFSLVSGYTIGYLIKMLASRLPENLGVSLELMALIIALTIILASQILGTYKNFQKGAIRLEYGLGIKDTVLEMAKEVDRTKKILLYLPIHFMVAKYYDAESFTIKPIGSRFIILKSRRDNILDWRPHKKNPTEEVSIPQEKLLNELIRRNKVTLAVGRSDSFPYKDSTFEPLDLILSRLNIRLSLLKSYKQPIYVHNAYKHQADSGYLFLYKMTY